MFSDKADYPALRPLTKCVLPPENLVCYHPPKLRIAFKTQLKYPTFQAFPDTP